MRQKAAIFKSEGACRHSPDSRFRGKADIQMSSIAAIMNMGLMPVERLEKKLGVMNRLQAHRGNDGEGVWTSPDQCVGLAQRRLAVIDIQGGQQPLSDDAGNWICFDGFLSNYQQLREELGGTYRTQSDAEVLLHAYQKWGEDCPRHLSGMFAFAIWDAKQHALFCARDHFGTKPLYYTKVEDVLYIASEIKALMPFLAHIETDPAAFQDYLVFQFCLGAKTLFKGVSQLEPAHSMMVRPGEQPVPRRYWQVYYEPDLDHTEAYFSRTLEELLWRSVKSCTTGEVPLGGYVSGGVDSSLTAALASQILPDFEGYVGKFAVGPEYDESAYSRDVAQKYHFKLNELTITSEDFINNIEKVIYHLDTPVGGPGSFSQFMAGRFASEKYKVMLGGEGGDEVFGGYTRYLVAYFEQCIKGAIEGTAETGSYVVTYESIIPNLCSLRNYKPMLKTFWSHGLFDEPSKRYFQLINRAPSMEACIRRENLPESNVYAEYERLFVAENVDKRSYLDRMTHFDFKTQLPALLQVEDRMSMAHGVEARSPFLDRELVEFAATVPASIKFKNGTMKYLLRNGMRNYLPDSINNRKDKAGFPTPFTKWAKEDAKCFVQDILTSPRALQREYVDNQKVLVSAGGESSFARNLWGFFCLELWQRTFHDRESYFHALLQD